MTRETVEKIAREMDCKLSIDQQPERELFSFHYGDTLVLGLSVEGPTQLASWPGYLLAHALYQRIKEETA